MYDTDTVRHITACLLRVSREMKQQADERWNAPEQDKDEAKLISAAIADIVSGTLRTLAYELEGDYKP